jgi:hypothetical protein
MGPLCHLVPTVPPVPGRRPRPLAEAFGPRCVAELESAQHRALGKLATARQRAIEDVAARSFDIAG